MRETVYPCSHSLEGVAVTGLGQELIKHSNEATECLKSDATGVYNPSRHVAVVAVRGIIKVKLVKEATNSSELWLLNF